ncbi:hypothetical protein HK104_007915, partial [Borealophlyctis nickersoniae]
MVPLLRLLLSQSTRYDLSALLEIGAAAGNVSIVKTVLEFHTTPITLTWSTEFTLISAAEKGDTELVGVLLQLGADVGVQGAGGNISCQHNQPLCLASAANHVDVVTWLISRGADVRAQGDTPLAWALWNGCVEVVDVLVEAGADVQGALERVRRDTGVFS